MKVEIEGRILLPKYALVFGEMYDPPFLIPRETYLLVIGHADDYEEVRNMFPDHILAHPMTFHKPFSDMELKRTRDQYIAENTVNGILDLSNITLEPSMSDNDFEAIIQDDLFFGSSIKVKYPNGNIAQL